MKRRFFLGAAATAAAGASGAALIASSRPADTAALAPGPRGAHGQEKFPNVPLLTHRGERVRFYDDMIRGNRVNVLSVMYTQCPEICGGTMVTKPASGSTSGTIEVTNGTSASWPSASSTTRRSWTAMTELRKSS